MLWISELIVYIISTGIVLVPALIMIQRKRFEGVSLKRKLLIIFFAIYVISVFFIVGIPRVNNLTIKFSLNIVPMVNMIEGLTATVLNIILFIPLGFMLPLIWNKYRSAKTTLLFGLGVSALIEISQIFTLRATDVDDLITNTVGTLLGYLIARIINDRYSNKLFIEDLAQSKTEPMCICGVIYLIMLLITPFLSDAFWTMI